MITLLARFFRFLYFFYFDDFFFFSFRFLVFAGCACESAQKKENQGENGFEAHVSLVLWGVSYSLTRKQWGIILAHFYTFHNKTSMTRTHNPKLKKKNEKSCHLNHYRTGKKKKVSSPSLGRKSNMLLFITCLDFFIFPVNNEIIVPTLWCRCSFFFRFVLLTVEIRKISYCVPVHK